MFDLFPAIAITDSTPFTWYPPNGGRFMRSLSVSVTGGDLYFGYPNPLSVADTAPYPGASFVFTQNLIGINRFSPAAATLGVLSKTSLADVAPGWEWTNVDNAVDDGNVVIQVTRNEIIFRDLFTHSSSGDTAYIAPPVVSDSNGVLLADGTERTWHSAEDSMILRRPIKFVAATGGTPTLRIGYLTY